MSFPNKNTYGYSVAIKPSKIDNKSLLNVPINKQSEDTFNSDELVITDKYDITTFVNNSMIGKYHINVIDNTNIRMYLKNEMINNVFIQIISKGLSNPTNDNKYSKQINKVINLLFARYNNSAYLQKSLVSFFNSMIKNKVDIGRYLLNFNIITIPNVLLENNEYHNTYKKLLNLRLKNVSKIFNKMNNFSLSDYIEDYIIPTLTNLFNEMSDNESSVQCYDINKILLASSVVSRLFTIIGVCTFIYGTVHFYNGISSVVKSIGEDVNFLDAGVVLDSILGMSSSPNGLLSAYNNMLLNMFNYVLKRFGKIADTIFTDMSKEYKKNSTYTIDRVSNVIYEVIGEYAGVTPISELISNDKNIMKNVNIFRKLNFDSTRSYFNEDISNLIKIYVIYKNYMLGTESIILSTVVNDSVANFYSENIFDYKFFNSVSGNIFFDCIRVFSQDIQNEDIANNKYFNNLINSIQQVYEKSFFRNEMAEYAVYNYDKKVGLFDIDKYCNEQNFIKSFVLQQLIHVFQKQFFSEKRNSEFMDTFTNIKPKEYEPFFIDINLTSNVAKMLKDKYKYINRYGKLMSYSSVPPSCMYYNSKDRKKDANFYLTIPSKMIVSLIIYTYHNDYNLPITTISNEQIDNVAKYVYKNTERLNNFNDEIRNHRYKNRIYTSDLSCIINDINSEDKTHTMMPCTDLGNKGDLLDNIISVPFSLSNQLLYKYNRLIKFYDTCHEYDIHSYSYNAPGIFMSNFNESIVNEIFNVVKITHNKGRNRYRFCNVNDNEVKSIGGNSLLNSFISLSIINRVPNNIIDILLEISERINSNNNIDDIIDKWCGELQVSDLSYIYKYNKIINSFRDSDKLNNMLSKTSNTISPIEKAVINLNMPYYNNFAAVSNGEYSSSFVPNSLNAYFNLLYGKGYYINETLVESMSEIDQQYDGCGLAFPIINFLYINNKDYQLYKTIIHNVVFCVSDRQLQNYTRDYESFINSFYGVYPIVSKTSETPLVMYYIRNGNKLKYPKSITNSFLFGSNLGDRFINSSNVLELYLTYDKHLSTIHIERRFDVLKDKKTLFSNNYYGIVSGVKYCVNQNVRSFISKIITSNILASGGTKFKYLFNDSNIDISMLDMLHSSNMMLFLTTNYYNSNSEFTMFDNNAIKDFLDRNILKMYNNSDPSLNMFNSRYIAHDIESKPYIDLEFRTISEELSINRGIISYNYEITNNYNQHFSSSSNNDICKYFYNLYAVDVNGIKITIPTNFNSLLRDILTDTNNDDNICLVHNIIHVDNTNLSNLVVNSIDKNKNSDNLYVDVLNNILNKINMEDNNEMNCETTENVDASQTFI